LANHPELELGGVKGFAVERRHHMEVFALHRLPESRVNPIADVEFTAIRGPHGTIPIRILYPSSGEPWRNSGNAGALVYFHGGGYSTGSVDEFENGLRLVAEQSGCQVYAVDYRLAPEFRYPIQLDEYSAVIDWLQTEGGRTRGVHPRRIAGGGDSAGGNMTAAVCLRRLDRGEEPLAAQVLLYPEARLPFDTPAAEENNSGYYLQCNGIFGFADNYLPRPNGEALGCCSTARGSLSLISPSLIGPSPLDRYVSPGMQPADRLAGQPRAVIFTNGFDPLRDVGIEYARKLKLAGVKVRWHHYDDLTHGWLQMTAWSNAARSATLEVGEEVRRLLYGGGE
jgi:acetyl esterase/lipase